MKYFIYLFVCLGFLFFIYPYDSFAKDTGASEDVFRLLTSAEAYINLGDYDSAIDVLDKAEKLDKKHKKIYFSKRESDRKKKKN